MARSGRLPQATLPFQYPPPRSAARNHCAPKNLPPPLCEQSIAPCQYSCIDLYSDAAAEALSEADVLFSYSVTWDRDSEGRLTTLSKLLASRLKTGARVITVGVTLLPCVDDVRFEPVASLDGDNAETGPESRGHVFRVARGEGRSLFDFRDD